MSMGKELEKAPTEAEIVSDIMEYHPSKQESEIIAKGLSHEGVPEREMKQIKKMLGLKYDFSRMALIDRFGNNWIETDVKGDVNLRGKSLMGGKWRIIHKDHMKPEIEAYLRETGRLPRGVRQLKEVT
jgi:hypothetical protein